MQNNIINNKPRNYGELEKIIIQNAIEEIGLFKNKIMKYIQTKK